jgi:hypothetical protein
MEQQAPYAQQGLGTQTYTQPSLGSGQFAQQYPVAAAAGQRLGQRFDQSVPAEVQTAIQHLDRVASVAEWTKTKASQRGMPRVVRVCDDIEDIAHLEKKLLIRQSPFAQPIGQASAQVIQQGLQELQQHVQEPEVQETIENVQQSLNSINQGLSRLQQVGQQGVGGQFGQQPQFGQQQIGQQPQYGHQQTGQQPQYGQPGMTPRF